MTVEEVGAGAGPWRICCGGWSCKMRVIVV